MTLILLFYTHYTIPLIENSKLARSRLIVFPNVVHIVMKSAPNDCGLNIANQFIVGGVDANTLNTSCLSTLDPIDFVATELSEQVIYSLISNL